MAGTTEAVAFATEVTIKASLLLLIVGGAAAVLARRSAAVRHLLWTLAIGGAVLLPLVSVSLPWSWQVLPSSLVANRTDALPAPPILESSNAVLARGSLSQATLAAADVPQGVAPPEAPAADLHLSPPVEEASTTVQAATAPDNSPTLLGLAAILWVAVAVILLLHQIAGVLALARLSRSAEPAANPVMLRELGRLLVAFDIRRQVRLAVSEGVLVPMTWGVARPVILIPGSSHDWSPERMRLVLRHELAHVLRLDALTLMVGRFGAALYWFNPLMWWALGRLRSESERAADDCVLHQGERASDYAGHLLDIVNELGHSRARAGALPLAEPSRLEDRLMAILEPALERGGVRRATALMATSVVSAVVMLLAAVAPAPAAGSEPRFGDEGAMAPEASPLAGVTEASAGALAETETPLAPPAPPRVETHIVAPEPQQVPVPATVAPARPTRAVSAAGTRQVATRDPRAVQALIAALRDDQDAEVRRSAAWALGQLEDTASTGALGEALGRDPSIEVRRVIAWAMGQIEDPRGVPALGDALDDEDVEVRRTSVWALGQIEAPEAVTVLAPALSDADADVRKMAVWALGQIGAPTIVAPLTSAVADVDPEVRQQAVWALGQLGSPESVPLLTRALSDTATVVRRQAAWALGQSDSPSAVSALASALASDPDAQVREQSAWALGQIDAVEGVPALTAALSDESTDVATLAAWALGQISPEASPAELVAAATSGSGELRLTALWALTRIGDAAAIPALTAALQDEDEDVRVRALNGLSQMRSAEAVEAITALLRDGNPQVRAAAARALAGSRGPSFSSPRPRPQPQPQPRPRPVPPPDGE